MTTVYLATGILLVIAALVVRDQTEFKLGRLRAELLALRSEAQRLGEERKDLEQMIAQAGEALMRADRRQHAAERAYTEAFELLAQLGIQPPMEASSDAGPDVTAEGSG